jgi:hypothetical protein
MAFILVVALVVFWWMAGWMLLQWAGLHRNVLRAALLAPATGVAAVVIPLFELYRLGVPVRIGGILVTAALCGAIGWRRGRRLPPRGVLLRVGLGLGLGGMFVGAPLLTEGLAWVSFCNDDMANYVLTAQGILERGYLSAYPAAAFVANADPQMQLKEVLDVAGLRMGAELLLAWVMALTGFADHRVFMPVIIGLQMALVGAAAGLICTGRRRRRPALAAMVWMPSVALVVLGAVYQLIGQVLGLGLLAATAAVLLDRGRQTRRTAVAGGALVGALGISYPEVIPFLGLGGLLYYGRQVAGAWRWLATVTAVALAVWNTFVPAVFNFFAVQLSVGTAATPARQFPFYLIPSGFPTFWGLMPIAGRLEGAWMDAAIAAGAALTAAGLYAIVRQYRRGEPAGAMALSFALVGVVLIAREADFGTYKAAMYIWPFLAGVAALTWWQWVESMRYSGVAVAMLVVPLAALPTSWGYVAASAGWAAKGSGFVEIPRATEGRLLEQLRTLAAQPREGVVVVDTHNVVLAKFAGAYFRGESYRTPSKNFFGTSGRYFGSGLTNVFAEMVWPGHFAAFLRTLGERAAWYQEKQFRLPEGGTNRYEVEQAPGEAGLPARYTLLRSGPDLTVLNRSAEGAGESLLSLREAAAVRNHLVLTDSYLGQNYYLAREARQQGRVALFQLEPDYFRPGRTMSSAGRHLLFEVLGPVAGAGMRVEVTASLNGDGQNRVPPVAVVGAGRFGLGAVGRGSARLQTPVAPLEEEKRSFLLLDMGVAAGGFQEERRGLLALFGRGIPLDNRKITGFVRDISMVRGEPEAPAYLADFRAGLADPGLLYSGAYEDGWVAEESFYRLRQPAGVEELALRVNVPDLAGRPRKLTVRVDEETPVTVDLLLGRQDVRVPVAAGGERTRRVELRFDRAAALSAADRRPASVLLEAMGFRAAEGAAPGREIPLKGVAVGGRWYPFEEFGGAKFRWVERDAEVRIDAQSAGTGELVLELEAGPGVGSKAFRLVVTDDAGKTVRRECHGGRDKYAVALPVKAGRNRFRLGVEGGGLPTPNDPRVLHFRVFGMEWKGVR